MSIKGSVEKRIMFCEEIFILFTSYFHFYS